MQARKFMVDSVRVETKVLMNDWIEIGVFGEAREGEEFGKLLCQQKHRMKSAKLTISVTVPHKQARAGIDPNSLLNDWEVGGNTEEVKLEKRAPIKR